MKLEQPSYQKIKTSIARDRFKQTGKFGSSKTKHGTSTAYYKYNCRCDLCSKYYKEQIKPNINRDNSGYAEAKAEFKKTGVLPSNLKHGTPSAYKCGCRCGECRKDEAIKHNRYRMRKKQKMSQMVFN